MRIEVDPIRVFQEKTVPPKSRLVGWSALVRALNVQAPVRNPCAVSEGHVRGSRNEQGGWIVFDKRYWPGEDFAAHLNFALRYEHLDLLLAKRIFAIVADDVVQKFVRAAPTGVPARRAWYLYEQFTRRRLDIPELPPTLPAVDLLDQDKYFTGSARLSRRHKVRDNLLGTTQYSPMIRRTPRLVEFIGRNLAQKASQIVGRAGANVVARAASFLLLADSRASFAIEGERPPRGRLERWARAVIQAGIVPLTLDEILRLHGVLIEDRRFVRAGLRQEGVFLGERDDQGDPIPEFIGARASDLDQLMRALIECNDRMREVALDPVLKAAATAFGFVYIHPFQDGNGRLHRCLIHHVLAERKFTPAGMVFPVSSVMAARIDEYRQSLQSHSGPLMPFIQWRPTPERNVEVLDDTGDLYRYFDCTHNAEFLYACVERTVEYDLPAEIEYLKRHDEAMRRIMELVEMPDQMADDLLRAIRENGSRLGEKRREGQFAKLTDEEVVAIEKFVHEAFEGFTPGKTSK